MQHIFDKKQTAIRRQSSVGVEEPVLDDAAQYEYSRRDRERRSAEA